MNEQREIIRMEDVEKRYGSQRVLEIHNLIIKEGEWLILSGSNGSGKSTLLRLLGGIARVDRGYIWRARTLENELLGYVPQNGGLYGDLSVRDNLLVRQHLYRQKSASIEDAWYIRALGLLPFLTKRFSELSGGYQHLAAIAAALHTEPSWLLLDEPFSGIDHNKRELLLQKLTELSKSLRLLVVTTPTPEEFPQATRWIHMEGGQITCSEL